MPSQHSPSSSSPLLRRHGAYARQQSSFDGAAAAVTPAQADGSADGAEPGGASTFGGDAGDSAHPFQSHDLYREDVPSSAASSASAPLQGSRVAPAAPVNTGRVSPSLFAAGKITADSRAGVVVDDDDLDDDDDGIVLQYGSMSEAYDNKRERYFAAAAEEEQHGECGSGSNNTNDGGAYHSAPRSGLVASVFNLMNDVLTITTVSMSYNFALCGVGLSLVMLVLFACLTLYTLYILHIVCLQQGISNLQDLSRRAYGKVGYLVACFVIFIFNLGGMLSAMMMIGQVVPPLLQYLFGAHPLLARGWVLLWATLVFLPISFRSDIASFAWTSFISTGLVIVIACVLMLEAVRELGLIGAAARPESALGGLASEAFSSLLRQFGPLSVDRFASQGNAGAVVAGPLAAHARYPRVPPNAWNFAFSTFPQAIGGFSYLFSCQDLALPVAEVLVNPTPRRWLLVAAANTLISMLVFFSVGFGGYVMFFERNLDTANVLEIYSERRPTGLLLKCLMVCNIVLSAPFASYMPKIILKAFLSSLVMPSIGRNRVHAAVYNALATVGIAALALLICELTDDLGFILELVGCVAGVTVGLIIPPLYYLKFNWRKRTLCDRHKLVCWFVMAVGVVFFVWSAGTIVVQQVERWTR